jgi:hypothetical protein
MAVNRDLQPYWNNAKLWHRTGDPVWMGLLEIMAYDLSLPSGRAAAKLVHKHDKEIALDGRG